MNREVSRELVEQVVREVVLALQGRAAPPPPAHAEAPAALKGLMERTPARIGVGRAGPRLTTATLLQLRADHARAKDAVLADVDEGVLERLGLFSVGTLCRDKDEFLTRPDLGQQFSEESLELIRTRCRPQPQVQVYLSDGLSARAVDENAEDILPVLLKGLEHAGIVTGTPFFVKYGRVPAMDVIAETLDSEITCVLLGERPGLASAGSMSAYIAYRARVGMPESRRTVVSNIQRDGIPAVEAGAYLVEVMRVMLERRCSGVEFKM